MLLRDPSFVPTLVLLALLYFASSTEWQLTLQVTFPVQGLGVTAMCFEFCWEAGITRRTYPSYRHNKKLKPDSQRACLKIWLGSRIQILCKDPNAKIVRPCGT